MKFVKKDIKGHPGYEISNFGLVFHGEKILRPQKHVRGYLMVFPNGHMRYIHRLVAEAFLGPIPAGFHVNHKNGRTCANHVQNLEIVTPRENHLHHYQRIWYRDQLKMDFADA